PGPHRPSTQPRGPVYVFKAGRWDRSRGDGGGFAAGGLADQLPPGPVLAGPAGGRGPARADRHAPRQPARLPRRPPPPRPPPRPRPRGHRHGNPPAEVAWGTRVGAKRTAAAPAPAPPPAPNRPPPLPLPRRAADHLLTLAAALPRLPATLAALAAGDIDLP